MNLKALVDHINSVTDEDFEFLTVLNYVNDGIAKINVECNSTFPSIDTSQTIPVLEVMAYTTLSEKWIRSLLVPFAAGRIKENDSSQFEYVDWYGQFDSALIRFRSDYAIPEEYKEVAASENPLQEDWTTHMFSPTKGW